MWRSEDEMLEQVRRRAARVHGRRRAVGTGVAATLVLVCVAVALVDRRSGGARPVHVAASGTALATSTTSVPSVDIEPLPFPTTPATVAGAHDAPTTVPPSTTVTTATATSTPPTTVAAGDGSGSTTTTSAPPVGACGPADALATTTVDKQAYLPGQPVRVTATLQNVSGRTCEAAARTSGTSIEVTNAAGVEVYGVGGVVTHADCFVVSPGCSWPEGETETARSCWDQTDTTTHVQVPLGTYTVTITWFGPIGASASAKFQIVADPAAPTTTVPAGGCP